MTALLILDFSETTIARGTKFFPLTLLSYFNLSFFHFFILLSILLLQVSSLFRLLSLISLILLSFSWVLQLWFLFQKANLINSFFLPQIALFMTKASPILIKFIIFQLASSFSLLIFYPIKFCFHSLGHEFTSLIFELFFVITLLDPLKTEFEQLSL